MMAKRSNEGDIFANVLEFLDIHPIKPYLYGRKHAIYAPQIVSTRGRGGGVVHDKGIMWFQ
jgi:hypothetical protein